MNTVGGNTRRPAAPAAWASRARSTASRLPSAYTPAMIGTAPATSSRAMASARLRSSRESDDTSAAWPLATIPVTPFVWASHRRWRRYAGSSIARSAVKGSRFAGIQPRKRMVAFMAPTLPHRAARGEAPGDGRSANAGHRGQPAPRARRAPAGRRMGPRLAREDGEDELHEARVFLDRL